MPESHTAQREVRLLHEGCRGSQQKPNQTSLVTGFEYVVQCFLCQNNLL